MNLITRDFASRPHPGRRASDVTAMARGSSGVPSVDALIGQSFGLIRFVFQECSRSAPRFRRADALAHLRSLAAKESGGGLRWIGNGLPRQPSCRPSSCANIPRESGRGTPPIRPYQPEISQGRHRGAAQLSKPWCVDLDRFWMSPTTSLLDGGHRRGGKPWALGETRCEVPRRCASWSTHTSTPQERWLSSPPARGALGAGTSSPSMNAPKLSGLPLVVGALFQYPGTYGHVPDLGKAIGPPLHAQGGIARRGSGSAGH